MTCEYILLPEQSASEKKELTGVNLHKWVGTAFEVGAGMGFKQFPASSMPYVRLGDNDETTAIFYKDSFGGSKYPKGNSWNWELSGIQAAVLACEVGDFTPSRREMVGVMKDWLALSSRDRNQMKIPYPPRHRSPITTATYRDAVKDPVIIASALDNRGAVYVITQKGSRVFTLVSKNKAFLDAMGCEYGGEVVPTKHKEKDMPLDQVHSFTLKITDMSLVAALYSEAADFLQFPQRIRVS